MFTFDMDGEKVTADVSFYTALIYESEFRSDVIQDLFGAVGEDSGEFKFDQGNLVAIDFTKVSWLSVAKALWSAVKTADPSTPSYKVWMEGANGVNLWEVRDQLLTAFGDCFFRTEPAEPEGAGAEEHSPDGGGILPGGLR